MSVMAHAGLLLKAPTSYPVLKGIAGRDGTGSITLPAGGVAGDTIVFVQHGSSGAPAGFTRAFATAGNQYGYGKEVWTKALANEANINVSTSTGFDLQVFLFAGAVTVAPAFQYTDANSGGTAIYTVATTAKNVCVAASDRGASSYPTLSATGKTGEYGFAATYFRSMNAYYPQRPVGSPVSVTDYNDTYGTGVLFFTVT